MMGIAEVIKKIAPNANAAFLAGSSNAGAIMVKYGIAGHVEQAQFLANMAAETGGFRVFDENMSYSAARLLQVFPKYFKSSADAQAHAHNPKKLAMRVYGGRGGNRPGTEDGYTYRGGGGFQHTFLPEYQRVTRRTGIDVVTAPMKIRTPAAADAIWHAACSYVVDRPGLLADMKAGHTEAARRKINGGTNGLGDVKTYNGRALAALHGEPVDAKAARTTTEEVDDGKKRVGQASVGTALGTPGGALGTKQSGYEWVGAIVAGALILAVGGAIIYGLYHRYLSSVASEETQRLEGVASRVAAAEAASPGVAAP